jgi:hypothetical protein
MNAELRLPRDSHEDRQAGDGEVGHRPHEYPHVRGGSMDMRRRKFITLLGRAAPVPLAEWALAALILATIPTAALASAAQECAASMASRDRLDHNGFKSRAKRYGLRAENVAYGCATEECARARWWKSAGHARNMMLPGFKEVASARSHSGRTYWCMEIHE